MNRIVFDVETNGYYRESTKMHSLVCYNIDQNILTSAANMYGYPPIQEAVEIVSKEDALVIGHNIIGFDLPVIDKLVGTHLSYRKNRYDTQVVSRLLFPNMVELDASSRLGKIPKKLWGKHSLEAWGERLRVPKGDFGKQEGFAHWSKEMQDYCVQDVRVTYKLYLFLVKYCKKYYIPEKCIKLEHEFASYIERQNREGVFFDVEAAASLKDKCQGTFDQLSKEISETIPARIEKRTFTPKTSNKLYGYVKGVEVTTEKKIPFKPTSRPQILRYMKETYNWVPEKLTKNNNPSLDTETLSLLPYPECKNIAKILDLQKLLGYLTNGKNSWLKKVQNGKIFGRCVHNGAVTGRCTHSEPNLAQIPSSRKLFGKECRELFYAPKGYRLVGADASGLELRMLAHYLYEFDNGEYARTILTGDIHTANQKAAGLDTRDQAKTFIYAFNYGAGNKKLGSIVVPDGSELDQTEVGRSRREQFLISNPAIGKLVEKVQGEASEKGYLVGLDGRHLSVREKYRALNTKLQGAGAVVMKAATIIFDEMTLGNPDIIPALHVHDEIQVLAKEELAQEVGKMLVESIKLAGKILRINIPLDGEYVVGKNWSETH